MVLSQLISLEEDRTEAQFQPIKSPQKVREELKEYYIQRLPVRSQGLERIVDLFLQSQAPSRQSEDGPVKTQRPCRSTQRTPLSVLWNLA